MREFFNQYGIANEPVAAGVSGGADSLALVLKMHNCGIKVVAITVDHGLRKESRQEAEYVAKIMRQYGIEHHILTWQGDKPTRGVEEAARQARYHLMFEFCKKHGIKYLAIGHHLRDQAETFLLRLARGSGVFGLSGILPQSEREGIIILRPQLDKSPEELREYLKQKNITWVEDPMNQVDDYLRVKIRKFLPLLAQEIGIDEKRLAQTAFTLQQTRFFLQNCRDEFINKYVRRFSPKAVAISLTRLAKADKEIARLVLGELIRQIGNQDYQPEAVALDNILLKKDKFKGCTLGGCELEIASGKLWIIPQDDDTAIMSVEEWQSFAKQHAQYLNSGLPYKVRKAIKKYWEQTNE